MQSTQTQALRDLQDKWYQVLKQEGFNDIEDYQRADRPLLEWHAFKYISPRSQQRQQSYLEYEEKIEAFIRSESFDDVFLFITNHWNSSKTDEAKQIWDLYLQGWTERRIANHINRSKTCVHQVLWRILEWVKVLV